ncbi:MAG TPA: RecX family transcriptional regulator [Candidatus Chromulinivoraceae bacterium]|nr:RecX family transcriptional regulator [Candidatus Chromulinivoraceae bacterium]
MKITAISIQAKNKNRVNVMVDGVYRFSLDLYQVADLGIRTNKEYAEEELVNLETESLFGKLYGRALEYCLMRPHSAKEVRDYLYKKTRDQRTKDGSIKKGTPVEITNRVFDRLVEKGYINDEKFAKFWIENRNTAKGTSQRKLTAELRAKGVLPTIIDTFLLESKRTDENELQKIINKKRNRYPDDMKLMQYLARQGFQYDDIKQALAETED